LHQPVVLLATAAPAKFPETIERALGFAPPLPEKTAALISKPERITRLPAHTRSVATFIEERKI
jgi:threonine synthase